jgi:hypothetical protein
MNAIPPDINELTLKRITQYVVVHLRMLRLLRMFGISYPQRHEILLVVGEELEKLECGGRARPNKSLECGAVPLRRWVM